MRLFLENIGKIGEACIEIEGITVIAGENNTGKSTVGKTLYCLFNAFHNINDKIAEERRTSVFHTLSDPVRRRDRINPSVVREITNDICSKREYYINEPSSLMSTIKKFYASLKENFEDRYEFGVDAIYERVLSYLKLDENFIKASVLRKILRSEFGTQVGHVNQNDIKSSISLEIHGEKVIEVQMNGFDFINVMNSIDVYSNIPYIEDPFVIDELNTQRHFFIIRTENHKNKLLEMLAQDRSGSVVSNVMEEMIVSEKLTQIFNVLNKVCEGSLTETSEEYVYSSSQYTKPLLMSNISTGLKTFLILKTLLMNGAIEEGGTIILDEPEIHLHPEWQLVFAELIVLMQKQFGIHILLNTHSPYFLRALQVYSAKYNISNLCKYYLSELNEDIAHITDVTDNIDKIYVKLSHPLQSLEDLRWRDD